jgi:hypothetical protein
MTIIEGTNTSQNVRLDYSNTAITIIQGVDVGQNARMTIIEGTDTSQNARMTIIDGVDVWQNTAIAVLQASLITINSNSAYSSAIDLSQNVRIDYSNTAITIIQGVDSGQNANIILLQALANTDFTTLTATAGVYGNSTFVPVVTLAANGRITSIVNTAISVTSSGGSSSGYLANSVIIANSTGYLSNTSNLLYYSANNTLAIAGNVFIKSANTAISNSATFVFNTTFNSLDTIFG